MFKKILFLVVVSVVSLFGADVNWKKDYHDALKSAKELNKPIMFISSRHTCKYCVILDKTTLKDTKVVEALNRDFISVISYSDENDYMPRELWRPGTPAIWFLNPDGSAMFQPVMGAIGAKDMLKALGIVKAEFDKANATE